MSSPMTGIADMAQQQGREDSETRGCCAGGVSASVEPGPVAPENTPQAVPGLAESFIPPGVTGATRGLILALFKRVLGVCCVSDCSSPATRYFACDLHAPPERARPPKKPKQAVFRLTGGQPKEIESFAQRQVTT
jgi:hypothetical protein